MANQINRVNFQGFVPNQKPATKQAPHFTSNSSVLSQPVKDQVSFSGAVLKMKTLQQVIKKMGLELVATGGRHGQKIVGPTLARPIPVPIHGGGKDIATGTANQIAKQLGFKNMHQLNAYV